MSVDMVSIFDIKNDLGKHEHEMYSIKMLKIIVELPLSNAQFSN